MRFDHALKYLGDFGRYQQVVYFTLCVMSIPTAWHSLGNTFLSASPNHQCRLYDGYAYNASEAHDEVRTCSIPKLSDGSWDSCQRYANASEPSDSGCNPEELGGEAIPCDIGWVYDKTSYQTTAVTEWDLVCEDNAQRQLSKTLVLVGKMVGSVIFGQFADFVGRKKSFTLSILLMVGVGTGAYFVTSFTAFLVLQFLLGVSASGTFVVAIVIATEMVGKSQRANAGIIIEYFYSVGYMSLALIAWRLRDWRNIELAISIPAAIFLTYYFSLGKIVAAALNRPVDRYYVQIGSLVPESPRWLISKGKTAEAEKIVRRAAAVNKVDLPESVFTDDEDDVTKKQEKQTSERAYNFIDLMRYPNLRKRTFNIYFNWLSNNLVYYGLSFFTEDLGNDPYLSFFISGAVEVPALIVCQLFLDRLGRKWLIFIFMTVGGVSLLSAMAIPEDLATLTLVIAMIGKLCITGSYAIIYLFAIELFPTPVRNVGVGMASFTARIGSISSPYVLLLADYTFPQLPFLVFGSFALLSGVLTLLLPETLGAKLPETMEEGEAFGKDMTFREMFKLPNCRRKHYYHADDIPNEETAKENDKATDDVEMTAHAYINVGVQTDD